MKLVMKKVLSHKNPVYIVIAVKVNKTVCGSEGICIFSYDWPSHDRAYFAINENT